MMNKFNKMLSEYKQLFKNGGNHLAFQAWFRVAKDMVLPEFEEDIESVDFHYQPLAPNAKGLPVC